MQAAVSLMISSSEKQDESRLENRLSLGRQKQGSVMERMGGWCWEVWMLRFWPGLGRGLSDRG